MIRMTTWKGIAPTAAEPEAPPRHDSESPKSGIRLVSPPARVPRPASRPPAASQPAVSRPALVPPAPAEPAPAPASAPPVASAPAASLPSGDAKVIPLPPPSSRKAAVKPRAVRPPGQILPPAPPIPAPSAPSAAPALTEPSAVIDDSPKPSPINFRSVISTAQDWPLVRPPAPLNPSFGLKYRDSFHSLPAFLPPPELLADHAPPMAIDLPFDGPMTIERASDGEIARSRRAMDLQSRRQLVIAGFALVVILACFVAAFLRQ